MPLVVISCGGLHRSGPKLVQMAGIKNRKDMWHLSKYRQRTAMIRHELGLTIELGPCVAFFAPDVR